MLVLSRRPGEAVCIEDVVATLIRATPQYAELALKKATGGAAVITTVPIGGLVDVCYQSRIHYLALLESAARLAVDAPADVRVMRRPA